MGVLMVVIPGALWGVVLVADNRPSAGSPGKVWPDAKTFIVFVDRTAGCRFNDDTKTT